MAHHGFPPQNGSHLAVLDLLYLLQQSATAAPASRDPDVKRPSATGNSQGNLETLLSEPVIKVDV